jgi:DNA replication and repair protein RecF
VSVALTYSETVPALKYISTLNLFAFRNYNSLRVQLDNQPVVLWGQNGAGKTNLMEALSLFAPGRGLRHAKAHDFRNIHGSERWGIHALLNSGPSIHEIATGVISDDSERRVIKVDGSSLKSQMEIGKYLNLFWLTPSMDRLLSHEASERRKFFDRLVYQFDTEHGTFLTNLEKNIKERSQLLKSSFYDEKWVSVLEEQIIDLSFKIQGNRQALTERLNHLDVAWNAHFPLPLLSFETDFEDLNNQSFLLDKMKQNRFSDGDYGGTKIGAHKSDLQALYKKNKKKAALCSTGEQKALLIALVLGYIQCYINERNTYPIVLLDEVVAHLDAERRSVLLGIISESKIQAFMTGTDKELFKDIGNGAQFLHINEAKVY